MGMKFSKKKRKRSLSRTNVLEQSSPSAQCSKTFSQEKYMLGDRCQGRRADKIMLHFCLLSLELSAERTEGMCVFASCPQGWGGPQGQGWGLLVS